MHILKTYFLVALGLMVLVQAFAEPCILARKLLRRRYKYGDPGYAYPRGAYPHPYPVQQAAAPPQQIVIQQIQNTHAASTANANANANANAKADARSASRSAANSNCDEC